MADHFLRVVVDSEQEAVDFIAKFLVREVGWSLVDNRADTSSDRDVVLSSPGESDNDNPHEVFIRIRGFSDDLVLFTYESYEDSSTYSGELSHSTYGNITAIGTFYLTVVADLDRVAIHVKEDGGNSYFGYLGRISSYYDWPAHPHPNLIKGMQSTVYDFFYTAAERNMWMIRPDGSVYSYKPLLVVNGDAITESSYQSARTGKRFFFALPVYSDYAGQEEIAGELKGVFTGPAANYGFESFVNINGKTYVCFDSSNSSYTWFVGPVGPSPGIPEYVPDIDWATPL